MSFSDAKIDFSADKTKLWKFCENFGERPCGLLQTGACVIGEKRSSNRRDTYIEQ